MREETQSEHGRRLAAIRRIVITAVIFLLIGIAIPNVYSLYEKSHEKHHLTDTEPASTQHAAVLEDDGLFGYKAADYADAVLGEASKKAQFVIYTQPIKETTQIIDTGFANLEFLSKYQLVTYHGHVSYSVDLGHLSSEDIDVSEDENLVTIHIPAPTRDEIVINNDDTEFGDVQKGSFLAIGDIELTAQQLAQVESEARKQMEKTMDEMNTDQIAETYARESVRDLFGPVIHRLSPRVAVDVHIQSKDDGSTAATASTAAQTTASAK